MATLLIERNVDFNVCKGHGEDLAKLNFTLTKIARVHNSEYGECCDVAGCNVIADFMTGLETAFGIEIVE